MWDAPREARCIAKLLPMPFAPPVITQTDPAGLNALNGGFGLIICDIGTGSLYQALQWYNRNAVYGGIDDTSSAVHTALLLRVSWRWRWALASSFLCLIAFPHFVASWDQEGLLYSFLCRVTISKKQKMHTCGVCNSLHGTVDTGLPLMLS